MLNGELKNTIDTFYKKDLNNKDLPLDWQQLCKMYKNKYDGKIQVITKYTRPGFDDKQAIFIQTMKSGEGILFCENGYVIETFNRQVIAHLNTKQIWLIVDTYLNKRLK